MIIKQERGCCEMNQLNEEIRIIQTQITLFEAKLYNNKNILTEKQVREITDTIIHLRRELKDRLKQTKEVDI